MFKGTRLTVAIIFENLKAGSLIEEIMDSYRVPREQINAVLHFAAMSIQTSPPTSVTPQELKATKSFLTKDGPSTLAIRDSTPSKIQPGQGRAAVLLVAVV